MWSEPKLLIDQARRSHRDRWTMPIAPNPMARSAPTGNSGSGAGSEKVIVRYQNRFQCQ
jgi:hypothetical protein